MRLRSLVTCLVLPWAIGGCALMSGKPPLPKQASLEQATGPGAAPDFAALVANADIIYFPSDRAASGGRSEPAALLLDAMQQNGAPFTVAWDLVDTSQQPLLDQLAAPKETSTREGLLEKVELDGSGRAREHCRAVLREERLAAVRHLALRCPPALVAKLQSSGLTAEEQALLPKNFAPPAGGYDAFAERLSAKRELGSRATADFYRAHLLQQQFEAEQIVQHCQNTPPGAKLVVFMRTADLIAGQAVPFYVAQKTQLRQLVLDSSAAAGSSSMRLLASELWNLGHGFQIVDCPPIPARDRS